MQRWTRASLVVMLGLVLVVGSTVPTAAQQPTPVDVFVGFRSRPGQAEEALIRQASGRVRHRYTIVNAIAARLPSTALQALRNNPNVTVVEPDIEVRAIHINATDSQKEVKNAWGVDRLDGEVLHTAGKTGSGVRLAIVDSGSGPHQDLNIASENRLGCIGQPCKQGSGSGYDDDNGHGSHVAGSAAAKAGNTEAPYGGVVGMAPGATLISLKVLGADGGGSYSDVVAALEWLVNTGGGTLGGTLQVANFSLGSSGDPGVTVKAAFDKAYNNNILIMAAAGNSGNRAGRGDNVIYPARYESAVAVAATDTSDKRPSWSSTGPAVDLAAPGVSIWSTTKGNDGYGYMSGTSMATPHASGAAALVAASGVCSSHTCVRERLLSTANSLGPENHYGRGLVDPLEATGTGSLETHK
ncbi:MAG: S8 family serine peptidase [Chloroflexi bacterium]|nr:S8 family serine peptidase [Chloroflexota bacterium]